MRPLRLVALALLAVVAATSCAALQEAAAVVNGEKISQPDFEEEEIRVRDDPNFLGILRQVGDEPQARGVYRRALLTTRIRQLVIAQEAERRGIEVGDEEIQSFLDDLAGQLGGAAAFEDLLEQANVSADRARVLARRQVLEREVMEAVTEDLEVPEDVIERVYEQSRSEFQDVHLLRMVLPTQEEAQEAVDALEGGADFEDVASDLADNDDPDVGFVPVSQLGGSLRAELEGVEEGGVIGPVPSQDGFAVYELVERRTQPLEEVRDRITEGLLGQRRQGVFEEWISEQMQEADIVVNPKYGRFDREALQVVPAPGGLEE